jgi:hypothetical protein
MEVYSCLRNSVKLRWSRAVDLFSNKYLPIAGVG